MPSFADSFWTDDLVKGMETLFAQLNQGCIQNELFIQLFASRMQFEVAHGKQLCDLPSGIGSYDTKKTTINRALNDLVSQMVEEGTHHINIASNIESTVLTPFSKWSEEHKKRVDYSETLLKKSLTSFTKLKKQVEKLEQSYFNKCRSLEDFKRENFSEEELSAAMEAMELQKQHDLTLAKEREFLEFGTFGPVKLDYKSTREMLKSFLTELEKHEYKVPFINYTIQNTNTGREITEFILKHMSLTDFDQAEAFGQDLIDKGFIKYCNGVSNNFFNSKKFQYQWKPYAYEMARLPRPGTSDSDTGTEYSYGSSATSTEASKFTSYFHDITSRITGSETTPEPVKSGPTQNLSENQRTLLKLFAEVENSDKQYRRECIKLDSERCSVEELLIDHYQFMEKCETDRLAAIKRVTLDFCACVGNKVSSMKIAVEKMIEADDSMDPAKDLYDLIAEYRTGVFQPKVIPYNNYYNPGGYQVFGIDLETRCRLDKKIVPLIVSTILSYMDQVYPTMENDVERTTVWTAPVKLQLTHQLRKLLNDKPPTSDEEILEILNSANATPSLVTSVLKVYLLELPTALIPDELYDVMKSLYAEFPQLPPDEEVNKEQEAIDSQRIKCIINTFTTLSKPRIATLDAITSHFYRLITILKMSSSESSKALAKDLAIKVSQEFANCILHVKLLDGNDLGFKIFYDLLSHKEVFGDLKKNAPKLKRAVSRESEKTQ
ncbi:HDL561Wp [Eremothecium sinecaudum]|uniref:HDL561Wp n=1 Tax=Eremothecium sinecaudum TaxID=45286 RepID=A0A0X8HRP2_9SACH|nr:HDL561Wp [Eremothecium sinecaudum]AMD20183.1 HDL561Wp [Eremothecium sinecaudum]